MKLVAGKYAVVVENGMVFVLRVEEKSEIRPTVEVLHGPYDCSLEAAEIVKLYNTKVQAFV